MKLTTALCTLALATAQDGGSSQGYGDGSQGADQTQQTQGAQTQGAQTQGAQDSSGYGEQAQSYGGEQESYGAESYEHHEHYVESFRPKICVTRCPKHAPYFELDSGNCVPGICRNEIPYQGGEENYHVAEPSYHATEQSGYRRLDESDNSYGYEAPAQTEEAPVQTQSYAAPVAQVHEAYAAPVAVSYEHHEDTCGDYGQEAAGYEAVGYGGEQAQGAYRKLELAAPRRTVDTRNNYVGNSGRIALWIGFGILFLSSVWFINRYLWFYYLADATDGRLDYRIGSAGGTAIYSFLASPALICGMVTFIASLAYLAMATHHGYYIRCFDGREFYYARYLDWIITTPLMLHALATGFGMENGLWHYMFFNDLLMIVAGLIGSTVGGGEKWIFFAFSMLCFIPIIYYLCQQKNRIIDNRMYDGSGMVVKGAGGRALEEFMADAGTEGSFMPNIFFILGFNNVMRLTVLAWSMYPVVWILAEGTGSISATGEAVFYTVLDVISKAGFGMLISNMSRNSYTELIANGYRLLDGDEWLNFDEMLRARSTANTIVNSSSSAL